MIRIGLSAPTLLRFRVRTQLAADRMQRAVHNFREEIATIIYAVPMRIPVGSGRRPDSRPSAEEFASHVALFVELERKFQDLVELLCSAAREGSTESSRTRFADVRAWLVPAYERIRPGLSRHLLIDPEDFELGRVSGCAARDAFEALFLPGDIDTVINSPSVILRIQRVRHAVDSYRDELDASRF